MTDRWTDERRSELVESYLQLHRGPRTAEAADQLSLVVDEYAAGLPVYAVSRCPFSGGEVLRSLDAAGLDGPYWNSSAPVRGTPVINDTLIGFTGAMGLGPEIEQVPWLVAPGPAMPHVLDRVLGADGVRAVLSSMAVGDHAGFVICYFTESGAFADTRPNDWGASEQWFLDASGAWVCDYSVDDTEVISTDLRSWIEDGRLSWIEPGDASLTLRSGIEGCPYLDASGDPGFQRIEDGKVWTSNTLAVFGEVLEGDQQPRF